MVQKFLTSLGEDFLTLDGITFEVLGEGNTPDIPDGKYERKRVILRIGNQLITGVYVGSQKITGLYIDTLSDEYMSDTGAVLGSARLGQMILGTGGN